MQVNVSDVDEREQRDYTAAIVQSSADQTYHDELTSAKAHGTTLNSAEATAAMS